jgi:hypothetical protein
MNSLTIQAQNRLHDEAIPKPAWPVHKPPLSTRLAGLLARWYGAAGMLAVHR